MNVSNIHFLSMGLLLLNLLPIYYAFSPNKNHQQTKNAILIRNKHNTHSTKLYNNNNNDQNDLLNMIRNQFSKVDPITNAKKKLVQSLAGPYDKAQIQNELQSLIDNEPLLMLSFTTCPFCIKAKQILDAKKPGGWKYKVLELNVMENGNAYRAEMAEMIGRTSVPAIWINGKFIGGCNDGGEDNKGIVQLDKTGKLDVMLKEAGVL